MIQLEFDDIKNFDEEHLSIFLEETSKEELINLIYRILHMYSNMENQIRLLKEINDINNEIIKKDEEIIEMNKNYK